MPGAACAYAWLHLLDRYVRTWLALERLVQKSSLPMGKNGVRALDVGTGPGPAAFAIHDFYAAMVEFSEKTDNPKWRQPAQLTCFEFDGSTNHFRHLLAEILVLPSRTRVGRCAFDHFRNARFWGVRANTGTQAIS